MKKTILLFLLATVFMLNGCKNDDVCVIETPYYMSSDYDAFRNNLNEALRDSPESNVFFKNDPYDPMKIVVPELKSEDFKFSHISVLENDFY